MKTLLLLNGPLGCQTGIEDGFRALEAQQEITELKWFYIHDHARREGASRALTEALQLAREFLPDIIFLFHVDNLPITEAFLSALKGLPSRPFLAYHEGDMYGSLAKPMTRGMRKTLPFVDLVSICGLGKWHEVVSRFNARVVYTPHHVDVARFDAEPYILETRSDKLVMIGNRIMPRFGGSLRRLSGAKEREGFVRSMGAAFPDRFTIYGNGWQGFPGNQGPVDFYRQLDFYRNAWVTLAYEHYPEIDYYYSNRLPMALLAGSLYVCHEHGGYENIFKNMDFIFFFRTNREAVDLVKFIQNLDHDDLLERSHRARAYALRHCTPQVVWGRLFRHVLEARAHDLE